MRRMVLFVAGVLVGLAVQVGIAQNQYRGRSDFRRRPSGLAGAESKFAVQDTRGRSQVAGS